MTLLDVVPLVISFAALGASFAFGVFALRDRRLTMRLSREADIKAWIRDLEDIYVDLQSDSDDIRRAALNRLHVVVDVGRLFFPNDTQGRRSTVLDPLVATFTRYSSDKYDAESIRKDWRAFVDRLIPQTTPFMKDTSPELLGERQYRNKG